MNQAILDRLKEPSTWRGLCLVLTAVGVGLEPAQTDAIVVAGIGLAGLIGVFTRDRVK